MVVGKNANNAGNDGVVKSGASYTDRVLGKLMGEFERNLPRVYDAKVFSSDPEIFAMHKDIMVLRHS